MDSSSNLIICHEDLAREAAWSGGSWALPLANALTSVLQVPAQSTDATTASTQFVMTWPYPVFWRVLAFPLTNLTRSARIRVQSSVNVDGTDPDYDSGWIDAFAEIHPWGSQEWGAPDLLDGKAADKVLDLYRRAVIVLLPAPIRSQWLKVDIDDAGNPSGTVEVPRCYVAGGLQLECNYSWRPKFGRLTLTRSARTRGGQITHDPVVSPRTARLAADWLTPAEQSLSYDIAGLEDVHGDLLIIPTPSDPANLIRYAMYCRLAELPDVSPWSSNHGATVYQAEEIV